MANQFDLLDSTFGDRSFGLLEFFPYGFFGAIELPLKFFQFFVDLLVQLGLVEVFQCRTLLLELFLQLFLIQEIKEKLRLFTISHDFAHLFVAHLFFVECFLHR